MVRFLGSAKFVWSLEKHERTKVLLVAAIFLLVITAYTVCKELKDIVFVAIVGKDYVYKAKLLSIFVLIPAILFYSYLVNKVRRYQLLYFYTIFYGILGLIFAYYLGHPTVGAYNTVTSPWRLFGWAFYIFIESYSPFLVGLAWAFANSIFSPKEAKEGYAFVVAGSKVGGVLSAGFGWYFLSHVTLCGIALTGVAKQQLLLIGPSLILLTVPFVVYLLTKKVSGHYLHGYEAVYEFQKKEEKKQHEPGIFTGLVMLIKNPYVLGIFSLIFFYETINAVMSYLRIVYAIEGVDPEEFGSRLFAMAFGYHLLGLFVALFGTSFLLQRLGERKCLLITPLAIGCVLSVFLMFRNFASLAFAFIAMRAINYGFFYPVRESLYIPTVKSIKFQSKAWIDAFGSKISKGAGSSFNWMVAILHAGGGIAFFNSMYALFFGSIIAAWVLVAQLIGKRYTQAIGRNEVIGGD